jgi:gliding motility associated protien GldN
MKKSLISLLIFLAGTFASNALMGQGIEELVKNRNAGAYEKKITIERKPAKLPGVREADVTWSKIIWRLVDLREKMNQQFYFPTKEIQGRNSLFNILIKGIQDNTITAFEAPLDDNNEFAKPISLDQIKSTFGTSTQNKRNLTTGQLESTVVQNEIISEEVKQLFIKEIWYFDKQKSSLQVRILGLCPIRVYYRNDDKNDEVKNKLFWVYYPEVRPLLARNEALNPWNGARNFSFDDLFLNRYFDGYIYKEENPYNNREILSYATGEYASRESERIKNAIFNFEQDLWEY